MSETYVKLILCLEKETGIYKDLLNLVKEERTMLAANRDSDLSGNIEKQNKLITAASETEKNRMLVISEITGKETEGDFNNISRLLLGISEPFRGRLKDLHEELKYLIGKIREVNQSNICLIEQGRSDIKSFLELIASSSNVSFYLKDGRKKTAAGFPKRIIDRVV